MYSKSFAIKNISEIKIISDELVRLSESNNLFLFEGEMGSGKTTLIKSVVSSFGVEDTNSPTYSIINTYSGNKSRLIYHVDCFRIENQNEVENIGLLEIINDENLCFIEWPKKINNFLPTNCVKINIKVEQELRKIIVSI